MYTIYSCYIETLPAGGRKTACTNDLEYRRVWLYCIIILITLTYNLILKSFRVSLCINVYAYTYIYLTVRKFSLAKYRAPVCAYVYIYISIIYSFLRGLAGFFTASTHGTRVITCHIYTCSAGCCVYFVRESFAIITLLYI